MTWPIQNKHFPIISSDSVNADKYIRLEFSLTQPQFAVTILVDEDEILPSTRLVNRVTFAAFLRPAGRLIPILSSLSLSTFPPSFDFARLRTPPRSEALRHSGGDSLLWTSATVTLYLEVEDSSDRRPGVEQKTSVARSLGGWGPSMEECEE